MKFQNVKFGYDPDKIIIKNFSADAQPGQKIAIVGPTGAGKTTLVKLLMRFYDLNDGAIFVDGHNIIELTRNDLRNILAWFYKIHGYIMRRLWKISVMVIWKLSDEEVIAAAKIAYADHFVHNLPDGYNMVLDEEANNLSQGQMQLLTIARAILANPKILILDEATSSVDTHTEVLIQNAMDNLMKNRTSFVIAHCLSTIHNADLILVLRDGDIIEQGTHQELNGSLVDFMQSYIIANLFWANKFNFSFLNYKNINAKKKVNEEFSYFANFLRICSNFSSALVVCS